MTSSFLSVSLLLSSGWQVSRYFQTLHAARRWARHLAAQSYCLEVAIHRGGPGGEQVAL
jgi:hypothetical protein